MPTLLKYYDLDLPVYGPEAKVILRTDSLKLAAKQESSTIVRQTRLSAFGAPSLKEALLIADQAFERVASNCGAIVLPHTWGLSRAPTGINPYILTSSDPLTEDLLPEGYLLVAEVPVLQTVSRPSLQQIREARSASESYYESAPNGELFWADSSPFQYINGVLEPENDLTLYLADIEPILAIK